MNFDELYLRYLGVKLPPSDEPEEPEEDQKPTSSIPNDIVAFVQPPRRVATTPRRTSSPNDPLIGVPTNTRTIVDDIQEVVPDYSDELDRSVEAAYKDVNGIYFQLYNGQATVRMNDFAESGLDDELDQHAQIHVEKYMEEMRLHYADQDELWKGLALGATEHTRKDLSNDRLESAVAVNIVTKEEIFRRFGDEDETPLQEENRAMIKDPNNTALVHNHWDDSPASQADFDAALWLGVRYLIVVTPSGMQYIYERHGDTMQLLDAIFNREHVALPSPVEDAESRVGYALQSLMEIGNPAERVMRQGKLDDEENSINMDSRLVREFLLNPSTVVFLEDVANEYTVEDPQLHNAMVLTIIYRELSGQFGLENADNPRYQHNLDFLKRLLQAVPFVFKRPLVINDEEIVLVQQLDGDPSLGIGALSREAGINIQSDAERLGMTMYFPMLGFDRPTTLDHVPFSRGEHPVFQSFFVGSLVPEIRMLQAIPPTNQEEGAWRVELPRFESGAPAWLREQYEPTLGYIAAEVAIAMQTPQYQGLQTDEQRMAYLIAYHANRSAIPNETLYNLEKFSPDTDREIRWARDFQELIDQVKNIMQNETQ